MYTSYTSKYHVTMVHNTVSDHKYDLSITEVFLLLEETLNGKKYSLVITPQNWKNICLIPISMHNSDKLVNKGAYYIPSTNIYSEYIDARIQLAYMCSKLLIPFNEISESTSGILNSREYKEIVKYFYEEFPEKYI